MMVEEEIEGIGVEKIGKVIKEEEIIIIIRIKAAIIKEIIINQTLIEKIKILKIKKIMSKKKIIIIIIIMIMGIIKDIHK